MPSHWKDGSNPDLAVTALLQTLNEELDREKRDQMILKPSGSVRCRLGPRVDDPGVQMSSRHHSHGGCELSGAIFMCNKKTWKECLGQQLFGLPISKKGLVEQIVPGMKLFLFEYEWRQLWGVFEAASYGEMNIIPNAYSGGSFPCQVRVNVLEECVALYEEEFCGAIKDNYFSAEKFHFDLSEAQVCHLTSLFERKYATAKRMHSDLLEFKDKQHVFERYSTKSDSSLLLTSDAACLHCEDLNLSLLPHSIYSSRRLGTQQQSFLECEEVTECAYGSFENFSNKISKISHRSIHADSLVSLPVGALVQNTCFPLNVDVASLTKFGGQLGRGLHFVSPSSITFHDTNNYMLLEDFETGRDLIPVSSKVQESMDTFFPQDNLSGLHSDRPSGKSVWARISVRSKPLVETNMVGKVPSFSSSLKAASPPVELGVAVPNSSFAQDVCKSDVEEFSVGFKRRRAINTNATTSADGTPSKRRRKLSRPSFEVSAETLVGEVKSIAEIPPFSIAKGAITLPNNCLPADVVVEDSVASKSMSVLLMAEGEDKSCLSSHVSDLSEPVVGEVLAQTNDILASDVLCCAGALDLTSTGSLSEEKQGVANLTTLQTDNGYTTNMSSRHISLGKSFSMTEGKIVTFNDGVPLSMDSLMSTEPCALTLPETTQETAHPLLAYRGDSVAGSSNPVILTGRIQEQLQALPPVWNAKEEGTSTPVNVPAVANALLKQVGTVNEGVGEDRVSSPGEDDQGFGVPQTYIALECSNLESADADSSRTNTLSLAPCTPAKEYVDNPSPLVKSVDDKKALLEVAHGIEKMAQGIPLTLVFENGTELTNMKLQFCDNVESKQVSDKSPKKEVCNEAVVVDDSPIGVPSNQSGPSSHHSGKNLLNQVQLKSFLQSDLQVSGVRLQLGATPCLILQLGDVLGSSVRVDSQVQEASTLSLHEGCASEPSAEVQVHEELSCDLGIASKEPHCSE